MKFLYGVKGCSHCDSRGYCPKELKNSEANLTKQPGLIEDNGGKWVFYCKDFLRIPQGEERK